MSPMFHIGDYFFVACSYNHRPESRKLNWLKDSSGMKFLKCRDLKSNHMN
jgi:hypothetical protein